MPGLKEWVGDGKLIIISRPMTVSSSLLVHYTAADIHVLV